jgi:transcription antitermination factor NusG
MGTCKCHRKPKHRASRVTHRVTRRYTHNRRIMIEDRRKPQELPELPDAWGWYVARVPTRSELRILKALGDEEMAKRFSRRTFSAFLPLFTRTRTILGREVRDPVDLPLLPGYLFVGMRQDTRGRDADHSELLGIEGVEAILQNHGQPVVIRTEALAKLAVAGEGVRYDERGRRIAAVSSFAPGALLDVVQGPFAGLSAEVVGGNEVDRVLCLIEIFGRPTPVRLPPEDLVEKAA